MRAGLAEDNYYQILGIGVRATQDEIKVAYKKLARKFHPDVNQGSAEHEEKFKKILEAYQTLSDQAKKNRYDLSLFYRAAGLSDASPGPDPAYRNVPRTPRQVEEERYRSRSRDRQVYREFAGPASSRKITPNGIAIALLVVSSFVMISYWMGYAMNHHMAKKYLRQGDFYQALEYDDEFGDAYFARYRFFSVRNYPAEKLLKDLNLAIRYADEPEPVWLLERARIKLRLDSIPQAAADFEAAKDAGPGIDSVWLSLADFYAVHLKRPEKALASYDTVLKIRPGYVPALSGKGKALYQLKRFPAAIACFSQCIEKDGADRSLFFMRGASLLALGKKEEACLDLNQALNMGYLDALALVDRYCAATP